MFNFIDWLRSLWRAFCFCCPFFYVLFSGTLCIQPVYFAMLLLGIINIFILFVYKRKKKKKKKQAFISTTVLVCMKSSQQRGPVNSN